MKDRISTALKEAMKARDTRRTSVLRMLLAEIKTAETSGQKSVDSTAAVASYGKRLDKSIDEYASLGRADKVDDLKAERAIVDEFLPQQLSAEETEAIVDRILSDGDFSPRDMGKVMKLIMADHRGQVDGKLVNQLVRDKLAAK